MEGEGVKEIARRARMSDSGTYKKLIISTNVGGLFNVRKEDLWGCCVRVDEAWVGLPDDCKNFCWLSLVFPELFLPPHFWRCSGPVDEHVCTFLHLWKRLPSINYGAERGQGRVRCELVVGMQDSRTESENDTRSKVELHAHLWFM